MLVTFVFFFNPFSLLKMLRLFFPLPFANLISVSFFSVSMPFLTLLLFLFHNSDPAYVCYISCSISVAVPFSNPFVSYISFFCSFLLTVILVLSVLALVSLSAPPPLFHSIPIALDPFPPF
jgi:hypothetical protein